MTSQGVATAEFGQKNKMHFQQKREQKEWFMSMWKPCSCTEALQ